MLPATSKDKSDQQSYFYVVWPEEKSVLESQVTLPSPQHPKEQSSPKMETAATTGSSLDTPAAVKDVSASHRFREASSPLQSPESEYLVSKQQTISPPHPHTSESSKQPSTFSPVHPFRVPNTSHQIISFPAQTIVSFADTQPILVSAEQFISKEAQRDSSPMTAQERGVEYPTLVPQPHVHKQLLQMASPVVPAAPLPRGQDVENFKRIGVFAEQAAVHLQRILQTTGKYQPLSKGTLQNPESEHLQHRSGTGHLGSPPAKRFCSWESPSSSSTSGVCMECEVKMAEIQILRKKIQTLQEHITSLSSRPERVFPSPLLATAAVEPPRIQHTSIKHPERPRLPLALPAHHIPEGSYPLEHAAAGVSRGRKQVLDTSKLSPAPPHPPTTDGQSGTGSEMMSELVPGSGVYILTQSLVEVRKESRSGTQLARKLMDIFWDKDTLAKSTLTPRSKFQYQQLDPKIIKAIEAYCLQYDDTVHSKDIHATMTDKCCQARSRIRTLQPETLADSPKQQANPNVLYSFNHS